MNRSREQLVADLRAKLLTLVDDEHSICAVAAEKGIFCGGFAQWTFGELKKRYPMIVRSRPHITPKELRELANEWQIARKTALGTTLACDTEMLEHGAQQTCLGWSEFSDEDLERFHAALCHEESEGPA